MEAYMFVEYRISMIFLLLFILAFTPLRYGKDKTIAVIGICFVTTGIGDWIQFFVYPTTMATLIVTVVQIVIVQATAIILCKYRDGRALFTGISAAAYVLMGNVMCSTAYILSRSFAAGILVASVVHTLCLSILLYTVRDAYLEELQARKKGFGMLCIVPALFYGIVAALAVWPMNIYENPGNSVAIVLVLILMITTYMMIIKMFSRQRIENEALLSKEFLDTYTKRLQHEIAAVKEQEEKAAILMHDMRHRVAMLLSYLDKGDMQSLRQILEETGVQLDTSKEEKFCENLAINGIVSYCKGIAVKNKVRFYAKLDVPYDFHSNEFEYATVISNLLENAVQAASMVPKEEEPFVKIVIRRFKGQEILEISNSFAGKCEFCEETGLPVSNKGENHGYGLRSVKAFAKKTDAIFDYSVVNQVFIVRLLVNA